MKVDWGKELRNAQTQMMRWGWLKCEGGRLIWVPLDERSTEQREICEREIKGA